MNHDTSLFLHRQHPNLSQTLGEFITSLQRDDPLAPVTVVAPSTYANLTLRHERARHGFANIQFLTLPRLSELLGAPSLSSNGRRPLTAALESAVIRNVAAGSSGMLASVGSHPSTHQSLRNTFRQLRDAPDDTLERLARRGALQREVVELYRQFRRDTSAYYTREDLARAAADAVAQSVRKGTTFGEDIGFVVFYLPREVTPAERRLIQALAEANRCAVFLGLTGDDAADANTLSLADRLKPSLGGPASGPAPNGAEATHLMIAPDPHQEIRWMMRAVMSQAESGVPFRRLGVLYRQTSPYGSTIREEFELTGIPTAGPSGARLADSAAGRLLIGLIDIAEGEFTRSAVMSWLTGCPVQPVGVSPRRFNPSRWDTISKEAGIVSGRDQWRERLEAHAKALETDAKQGKKLEDLAESRVRAMKLRARSARDMLAFIERLIEDAALPSEGSAWTEYSRWAAGLLDRYLDSESGFPESESDALEKIRASLSSLEAVDSVSPPPTFSAFRDALSEVLQSSPGHSGATGRGVFVAPVGAAIGMSFDAIYMVGMVEGGFPPSAADDPLISERDKQAVGGSDTGLPLRQHSMTAERYEFLSALSTAPSRTLSYPKSNPASGRTNYPSRWFLEQASELEGSRVSSSEIESLGRKPWLTVIPSMELALASVSELSAADVHDHDLELLWSWKRGGRPVRRHPLAASGPLARSIRMGGERYGSRFTEWDGNLSDVVESSGLGSRVRSDYHSPTSLERWAKCPFSYFLGSVLRIGSTESPEDVQTISAIERGSLAHSILEKFIRKVREESRIPSPGESWDALHRETLMRIAERCFQDAEERGVTGRRLLWNLEKENILEDLDTFLVADTEMRARFGVSPVQVEARFGMRGESWDEAVWTMDDGSRIKFRGLIDRVDISPDGAAVLVLDYKTGGRRPYEGLESDPIDKGQRLQLAVYSLAARANIGSDADVRAAYWFVTSGGDFALVPQQPIRLDDETSKRFEEGVSTIVSGIERGLFPANPGGPGWQSEFKNCGFCDFDSLCPSRRGRIWENVRSSPLLKDYTELSSEE